MVPYQRLFSSPARAFSLIEAAIVLGIIGLVIGGIWIAAAKVQSNLRHENIRLSLFDVRARAQEKWTGIPYPDDHDGRAELVATLYPPADVIDTSTVTGLDWDMSRYAYRTPYGFYVGMLGLADQSLVEYKIGPLDYSDCVWVVYNIFSFLVVGDTVENGDQGRQVFIRGPVSGSNKYFEMTDYSRPLGEDFYGLKAFANTTCVATGNMVSFNSGRP